MNSCKPFYRRKMYMNSFELIPTEENLIKALEKDLLKRNKDLVRFYDLILAQEGFTTKFTTNR